MMEYCLVVEKYKFLTLSGYLKITSISNVARAIWKICGFVMIIVAIFIYFSAEWFFGSVH